MSVTKCTNCWLTVDTDYNAEHFPCEDTVSVKVGNVTKPAKTQADAKMQYYRGSAVLKPVGREQSPTSIINGFHKRYG